MELTNEFRDSLDKTIQEDAKYENGCCFYIYSWLVKWFQPFSRIGI
jgi:hypothetical protein